MVLCIEFSSLARPELAKVSWLAEMVEKVL